MSDHPREHHGPLRRNGIILGVCAIAVITGIGLLISFQQFYELHKEFFSANFDSVHNARAILKTRQMVDKFQTEVQTIIRYRDPKRLTAAQGHLLLARQYEQTMARQANPMNAWLPGKLDALDKRMQAMQQQLEAGEELPVSSLQKVARDARDLVDELDDSERDRWAMLSSLNAELGARISKIRNLIAATGVIFGVVTLILAWLLFIKQKIERRLQAEIGERKQIEQKLRGAKDATEDANLQLTEEIAERKQAEQRLNEVIAENQIILDKSPVGIALVLPLQQRVLRANLRLCDMLGYASHELLGRNVRTLYSAPPSTDDEDRVYATLASGNSYTATVQMQRSDGQSFWCKLIGQAIDPPEMKRGAIWILEDVTEIRRAQAQLVESEKMAALGQLVAGVAHEINTPIGVSHTIVTNLATETSELATKYRDGQMKRADLEDYLLLAEDTARLLVVNIGRAAGLIRSFKQVAVDQSSDERRQFNLNDYLHEIITSLTPQLRRSGHQVAIICPPDLVLDSFPGALSQVISNLVMNALLHAFDPGQSGQMVITVVPRGYTCELEFRDNGKGIPAENLGKIFDPFFTTKRGTGGSGLGLNIVYNLVNRKLQGAILCHSSPGNGAVFSLSLAMVAGVRDPGRETLPPFSQTQE